MANCFYFFSKLFSAYYFRRNESNAFYLDYFLKSLQNIMDGPNKQLYFDQTIAYD